MKKFGALLLSLALAMSSFAQEDITNTYLDNADFATAIAATGDVSAGSGGNIQNVDGWQHNSSTPWSAGAVFGYGSAQLLKGNGTKAPTSGPEGDTSGKCLGVVAAWGGTGTVQYYQEVTLPAGAYRLEVIVWNQQACSGGTSLIGWIPNSGSSVLSGVPGLVSSNWRTLEVRFSLAEATTGKISLGYTSNGGGSASNPHLYFNQVKLYRYDYENTFDTNETYYLYNVDGDGWVREGNDWGTKAVLKPYGGMPFKLASTGLGYQFKSSIYGDGKGLSTNYYINSDLVEWDVEKLPDGTYGLYNSAVDYLKHNGLGGTLSAVSAIEDAARWKVVSKTQRTADLALAAIDSPMDATYFISNPDFSREMGSDNGNPTGWTVTSGGGSAGINGEVSNFNWQQWNSTFHIRQTLKGLPEGVYELKMQGFYRPGSNADAGTAQNAELYAGDFFRTPIRLVASDGKTTKTTDQGFTTANTNGGSTVYVPNSQGDVSKVFNTGAYDNSLTFVVAADGEIVIGAEKTVNVANDWTVLDNMRLFYLGATLSDELISSIPLPSGQMNSDVKQAMMDAYNALQISRNASDYSILLAKMEAARSSIEEYKKINTFITYLNTENQRGEIPEVFVNAAAVVTRYSDGAYNNGDGTTGTYETSKEVVSEWQSMVTNYWTVNPPEQDANLTAFVVNQGFELDNAEREEPTGWTVTYRGSDRGSKPVSTSGSTYYMSNAEGLYLFNNWDTQTTRRDLSQHITGLPSGTYRIAVVLAGSGNQVHLRANGNEKLLNTSDATSGIELTLEAFVTSSGELDLSVYVQPSSGTSFFKADNFRLTYLGSTISQDLMDALTLPSGQMNSDVKQAMMDSYNTLVANRTTDNYLAVLAKLQAAEASVAEYVKIKSYIDNFNSASQLGGIASSDYLSSAVCQKYSNGAYNGSDGSTGTYVSLDEVIPCYRNFVSEYWTAHKSPDADMTAFIVNQGFEFGQGSRNSGEWLGWNNPWDYNENDIRLMDASPTAPEGTYYANLWSADATLYSSITLSQELTGLPSGTYELSAMLTSHTGYKVTLAGGEESTIATITADNAFERVALQCLVGGDGKLLVNVNTKMQSGQSYFKADDFRLVFKDSDVLFTLPTKEEGIMKQSIRDTEDATYAAFAAERTADNYHAAIEAYNDAVESVAAYAKAKATIDKADDMLNRTNVYTYAAYKKFYSEYLKYKNQYTNRVMTNNLANTLEYTIFGTREHHQTNIMVVPFLGSAWDHAGDYTWSDYWVNTWSNEGDSDGSNFVVPFMEYWSSANLAAKTLTATALGTAGVAYTVTADVRLGTTDGKAPKGISMQVGSGTPVAITGDKIGTSKYYLTTSATASGTADTDGLKIKFIVSNSTNVNWLAYKNVWVEYSGESVDLTGLHDAIVAASGRKLGFLKDEYAPYTNVEMLKALEAANLLYSLGASAPPALVNAAKNDLAHSSWTQNTADEMNAIFWTSDYTKDQVYEVHSYTEDGKVEGTFRCLDPNGWDLDGRADAYATRIQKYGVNASDVGLRAIDDETGLFVKYNTNYGKETGYTMPLEPNTKYSLSFIYCCWGENKDIKSIIRIHNKTQDTYATLTEEGGFDGYTNNSFTETGRQGTMDWFIRVNKWADWKIGNSTARNWDVFRGYFVTGNSAVGDENDEYELIIEKDREFAHNVLGYAGFGTEQYQIMLGDIYILRYNATSVYLAGDDTDVKNPFHFADKTAGSNIELKRTITANRWNTIVLPFKLIWREMNQLLGVEKLYYYKGTSYSGHYAVLNFEGIEAGLRADVPVLIRWESALDTDKHVINGSEANGGLLFRNYITCGSTPVVKDPNGLFNFTGTYDMVNIPQWAVYVKYNKETGESELVQKVVSGGNSWMQPTRAYFTIDPSVEDPSLVKLMSFTVDDLETGIMAIEPDGAVTVTSGNIYDLNGRIVRSNAKTLEGLPRGIYIVDGRKVSIR